MNIFEIILKETSVLTFWLSDYADGLRVTDYRDNNVNT
jgi:hypothetical protein